MTEDEIRYRLTIEFKLGHALATYDAPDYIRVAVERLRQRFVRTDDIAELTRLCAMLAEYVE